MCTGVPVPLPLAFCDLTYLRHLCVSNPIFSPTLAAHFHDRSLRMLFVIKNSRPKYQYVGDVAQMVECALSMREVKGSMPIFSTFLLDSIVVSISAFHAGDPGSIPGRGVIF